MRGIFSRMTCFLKSVEVSTRIYLPAVSTMIEARVRLSRGSPEEQTEQPQPTIGTPVEVPLPRIVIFMVFPWNNKDENNMTNMVQARGLSKKTGGGS
jgi:hypothetical protein